MRKLKTIALLGTVLILCLAFAGCSKNNSESNKYVDSWFDKSNQNAIIKIKENDEKDGYKVQIVQAQSNSSEILWSMDCTYDKDSGDLTYKNATKTDHSFDTKGKETKEKVYTDGTGSFHLEDGQVDTLTWTDDKDEAGAGCSFFRFDEVAKDIGIGN